jgi:hypothetical protein
MLASFLGFRRFVYIELNRISGAKRALSFPMRRHSSGEASQLDALGFFRECGPSDPAYQVVNRWIRPLECSGELGTAKIIR